MFVYIFFATIKPVKHSFISLFNSIVLIFSNNFPSYKYIIHSKVVIGNSYFSLGAGIYEIF